MVKRHTYGWSKHWMKTRRVFLFAVLITVAIGIGVLLLSRETDKKLLLGRRHLLDAMRVRLRARGGFVVDATWKGGAVTAYEIYAPTPRPAKVRVNGVLKTITAQAFPAGRDSASPAPGGK
jgi:hypothetical protein